MVDPIEIKIVGEDDSGKALASAEGGLKDLGATAEKTTPKLKGVGDGISGVGDKTRKTRKDTEEQAKALDRVGEAGGNAESQFLGLGAGISGVSTLMQGGKLSAEDMAMATADIGDSIEHTVVPWLGKGKDMIAGFIEKLGGLKGAALAAGGAAGIGALIFAAKELEAANQAKVLDEMAEGFASVNYEASEAAMEAIRNVEAIGMLDEAFAKAEASGGTASRRLIDLAEKAGISKDVIAEYRKEIEQKTSADEAGTEAEKEATSASQDRADAIRGVSDAMRAQVDPLFGMIDGLERNRDAQTAVTDAQVAYVAAVKEHGEGSKEAEDALRDLNSTQDDAVRSAADYEAAAADLEAQIAEHPATLSNARLALQRWVAQGLITEDQAKRMATRFANAADRANDIQGTRTATLRANDRATGVIRPVQDRLEQLDGNNYNVSLTARAIFGPGIDLVTRLGGFGGHAAGGVVGAAGGGVHGGPRLVGENGPELVDLPSGSMVHPAANTAAMLGAAGGGGGLTVHIHGSVVTERELFDLFRDIIRNNYGGDVDRALGWG